MDENIQQRDDGGDIDLTTDSDGGLVSLQTQHQMTTTAKHERYERREDDENDSSSLSTYWSRIQPYHHNLPINVVLYYSFK